ncbi:NUDIX domain-containing protein [Nocardia sp. bgisy134]|uniref:NUDIX domain-containing protein n=1 Tax=unclassified Nocardia TaxID=2637762 RepID=UPI003D7061B3
MADYIRWLRERVGHDHIQLAYAAACVVADGRVLMQRRSDDGQWGLPGGAIELGESAASAVVREVAEETGPPKRAVCRALRPGAT